MPPSASVSRGEKLYNIKLGQLGSRLVTGLCQTSATAGNAATPDSNKPTRLRLMFRCPTPGLKSRRSSNVVKRMNVKTGIASPVVNKGLPLFDEFKKFEGDVITRSFSRSPVGKLGLSVSERPEMAGDFSRPASPASGTGAAILPLRVRADKVGEIDLAGDQ